jgi:hypothetical protein
MGGDSEPPRRGSSRTSENPPPRCDVPSDKSKRDADQKPGATPARPFSSPQFAEVMDGIVDQLLDQLHAQQNFVAEHSAELEQEPDLKKAAQPISQRSFEPSKQLKKGRECEERAQEIATIRRLVRSEGMTIHQVRRDHPGFGIWEVVEALPKEWKDTFAKPMEWGPAKGFANNLLAEFTNRRPSTVEGWRKAWRTWRDHEGSSSKADSSRDRKAS